MFDPNYVPSSEVLLILARVLSRKATVDEARPLSAGLVRRLQEDLSIEWTYNSNAIEGNSLTLIETKVVLQEGMTIGGKSLREHFEAINHKEAIHFLEELVEKNTELRLIDILSLHELVLKNIDKDYAGRLRDVMVRITGANFTPPSARKVSDMLSNLLEYVTSNPSGLPLPILASLLHHRFVWIHPFTDGNGRTARLLMNLVLQKAGFPPAIILKVDRKKYYQALNLANNGKYDKFVLMVLQALERSLNMYINIIPKQYEEFEPVSTIAKDKEVPYGAEYISLLARKGLISAHKERRNWVTTKDAVMEYAKGKNKLD